MKEYHFEIKTDSREEIIKIKEFLFEKNIKFMSSWFKRRIFL